jgi:hypothetical protein
MVMVIAPLQVPHRRTQWHEEPVWCAMSLEFSKDAEKSSILHKKEDYSARSKINAG